MYAITNTVPMQSLQRTKLGTSIVLLYLVAMTVKMERFYTVTSRCLSMFFTTKWVHMLKITYRQSRCTSSKIKYDRINGRVFLKRCLIMKACNRPRPSETPPSLCKVTICSWYRHTHPESHLNCKTCGKRLENSHKSRFIPEPLTLENAGDLQPKDRVCYTSYSHSQLST